MPAEPREGRAARDGLPLVRRAGVVRRRPLPAVERHPERPHHALGRGDGCHERLPQALAQRERQHARPPGPPRHLRARHAPRDAHRIRRLDHGDRRALPGQAAQLAERRRVQVGRLDLVHRPAVRDPRLLRGPQGGSGAADERLPPRSRDRGAHRGDRRRRAAQRPRLLTRRVEALRGRGERPAALDPRLRRRGRHPPRQQDALAPGGSRHARRPARGRGRQPVDRLGHGRGRPRRRRGLQPGGPAHRPHRPARALRQPLLRRPIQEPPVHVRLDVDLLALREHAGRGPGGGSRPPDPGSRPRTEAAPRTASAADRPRAG